MHCRGAPKINYTNQLIFFRSFWAQNVLDKYLIVLTLPSASFNAILVTQLLSRLYQTQNIFILFLLLAWLIGFLGAFAKLLKATISFVMSVRLSVRPSVRTSVCMEQFGSHWTDFYEISYSVLCENLSRNFKFHLNRTRITDTLHAAQYTFLIILRSFLLRVRNVSHKVCRENQNMRFVFNSFFRKSCRLWDNEEKYCIARQATDDKMAHAYFMLVN